MPAGMDGGRLPGPVATHFITQNILKYFLLLKKVSIQNYLSTSAMSLMSHNIQRS